jgi:putative phage-type endonuclease
MKPSRLRQSAAARDQRDKEAEANIEFYKGEPPAMPTTDWRRAWLEERRRIPGVGASDAAALFNLHPYVSAFSLFQKLVDPQPLTDQEQEEENDVQSFGHAIEPYLADWYGRKTQRVVRVPALPVYRLTGRPYIFASPDRCYYDTELVDVANDLELKSAVFFSREDPLPDYWQIQLQQQLLCTGWRQGSLAILAGFRRRYHVDDIAPNPQFAEILIETIDRFMAAVHASSWDRWGGEIEGSRATAEALRRLYRTETGETITLDQAQLEEVSELDSIKEQIQLLERRKTLLSNRLKAVMAHNTYGLLPDGSRLSLRTVAGSSYTVTKEDYRVLKHLKGKIA